VRGANKQNKKKLPGFSWSSLKVKWQNWLADKSPILFFGAKFLLLMSLLYGLLAIPFAERILYSYLEANAWLSSLILNALGQGTHVTEVTIYSPAFTVAIRRGCDAVEPTWLLCAAIVAFPGAFRSKLAGMLAGLVILQLLNLVRIVSLFLIGCHFPAFFPSAHLEIWPALFIMVAIMIFIGWRGWAHAR
jgi:exosortase/archaeosortase family protein